MSATSRVVIGPGQCGGMNRIPAHGGFGRTDAIEREGSVREADDRIG